MHLPIDIQEYKKNIRLWFGGMFVPGREIHISRAPASQDIMGGTFDYAGSVAVGGTLEQAVIAGVQKRLDLRILLKYNDFESKAGQHIIEYQLDKFYSNGQLKSPDVISKEIQSQIKLPWASQVLEMLPVMLSNNTPQKFQNGITICIKSNIPQNGGIGSNGAMKTAVLQAIKSAFNLSLDAFQIATLAKVNGMNAGSIMETASPVMGKKDKLLAMRCQPLELLKMITLPHSVQFLSIDTKYRQEACDLLLLKSRVSAFIGQEIIFSHLEKQQKPNPYKGYLCNITPSEWEETFKQIVPEQISGKDFMETYDSHQDMAELIDPDTLYPVREHTAFPIYENDRVLQFIKAFDSINSGHTKEALMDAGDLLFESHDSFRNLYDLGSEKTDYVISLIKEMGPANGFYGARLTSESCGGTVLILTENQNVDETIENLAAKFLDKFQVKPILYKNSSQGALEFGSLTVKF